MLLHMTRPSQTRHFKMDLKKNIRQITAYVVQRYGKEFHSRQQMSKYWKEYNTQMLDIPECLLLYQLITLTASFKMKTNNTHNST